MKRAFLLTVASVALALGACGQTDVREGDVHNVSLPEPITSDKNGFGELYEPVPYDVTPAIDSYDLPLAGDQIANLSQVVSTLGLENALQSLLDKGFVVVSHGEAEDVSEIYRELKEADIPIFVTADTWLHLYHVQFDEILKELEEDIFYRDIVTITDSLLNNTRLVHDSSEGLLREAARRNLAYLSVARELLTVVGEPGSAPAEPVPAEVAREVADELAFIEAHSGFNPSPIFSYKEDYSQYLPRGHYTRSERLKSYFKTLMWYGRMTMLIKGGDPACEYDSCPALVLPDEADIQTVQALLLTVDLQALASGDTRLATLWENIYQVTAFFVGLADDLTLYEYQESIDAVMGSAFALADLTEPDNLFALRVELARKRSPQIYGGTGGQVILIDPGEPITPDMLDELLAKSKGFRFMGQRFIPDSYAMGKLVSPGAGVLTGSSTAFTAVLTEAGWVRGFPRGLDVMALLGSKRAKTLLTQLGDDAYTKYTESFAELNRFFTDLDPTEWHRNLYWGWLHVLKSLLAEQPAGTQTFMRTDAWMNKSLSTALASWSELRHDTILYAKQSYTPGFGTTSETTPTYEPPGYVEPNPEFFARMLALNRMTIAGLSNLGALNDQARIRLESLGNLLAIMLDLSTRELSGQDLYEADHDMIRNLADHLDAVLGGVEPAGVKTTMVADVHTDQNSGKVLEEGVGHVELMVVVLRQPDGHLTVNAGPVFSYYEFKHPMSNRLTDEEWRDLLVSHTPPDQPSWTHSYRVP